MRIFLEVLQHNVEGGHIVIRPVDVLDGDIGEHLGERLQQLGECEVVLVGNCLHVIVSQNSQQRAVVVLNPFLIQRNVLKYGFLTR